VNHDRRIQAAVFVALVSVAVAVRLATTTPNFGAVAACALFAGFYFSSRLVALAVPLVALSISDQFLGGYSPGVMLVVYAAAAAPIVYRSWLRTRLSPSRVGISTVASSLLFYGATNFAVWCAWYPHTWEGFSRCYAVALPFFVNTLRSDALFSLAFFGAYAVVAAWNAAREMKVAAVLA
jgi:hypothetical protein